jgi:YD repeat-containing protein
MVWSVVMGCIKDEMPSPFWTTKLFRTFLCMPRSKSSLADFFRRSSTMVKCLAAVVLSGVGSASASACHVPGILHATDTLIIGDRSQYGHSTLVQGTLTAGKYLELGYDGAVSDSMTSGGDILLRDRSSVLGAVTYAGILAQGYQVQISGRITHDPTASVCPLIADTSTSPGTIGYEIPYDSTMDLAPGSWGDVKVHSRSTLRLLPGTYQFKTLTLEPDAAIQLVGDTGQLVIKIAGDLSWGDRVAWRLIGAQTDSSLASRLSVFSGSHGELAIGYSGTFLGHFLAPHAKVIFHSRTFYQGTWAARFLTVESDLSLLPLTSGTGSSSSGGSGSTDTTSVGGGSNWASGGCLDTFAFYGTKLLSVGDRSILGGWAGTAQNLTLGFDSKALFKVNVIGELFMHDRSSVTGQVRLDGQLIRGSQTTLAGGLILDTTLQSCWLPRVTVSAGTTTKYVGPQSIDSLPPGSWGDVVVSSGATLRIHSGMYQIRNLQLQPDAVLELQDTAAAVEIRVDQAFQWGDRVRFRSRLNLADTLLAGKVRWYLNTNQSVQTGTDGVFLGIVLAPVATVELGSRTRYIGRWLTQSLTLDPDVVVQSIPNPGLAGGKQVRILQPTTGTWTNADGLTVVWTAQGVIQSAGAWEDLPVQDGLHTIRRCSGGACDSVLVHVKRTPPDVQILSPANGSVWSVFTLPLIWSVDGVQHVDTVYLAPGWNTYTRCAEDLANNSACARVRVLYSQGGMGSIQFSPGPDIYAGSVSVGLSTTQSGAVIRYTTDGTDPTTMSSQYNGSAIQFNGTGEYLIKARTFINGVPGPVEEGFYAVTPGIVLPEPVAPVLDPTQVPLPWQEWNFLYRDTLGHPAVQTGVTTTFDNRRISHLSGNVIGQSLRPLVNAKVSVFGHPEYGSTRTRANGEWDLVVNSGGNLDMVFSKEGLFTVHRLVSTLPRKSIRCPQVRMVTPSAMETVIDASGASTSSQVAQGDPQEDRNGFRQPSLIIPAGIKAFLIHTPDSVTLTTPAQSLGLRLTEYTVGPKGAISVPASLPDNAANTYTLEISSDEARVMKASQVKFSDSVALYTNNYLDFPVGTKVPLGWYDREKGLWIPAANGQVLRIVGIVNGRARVSNTTDPGADLVEFNNGFDPDELAQLARLYGINATLWRVTFDHITPWSMNWGYALPANATPWTGTIHSDRWDSHGCSTSGCEVDVQNRALSEHVQLANSGEDLVYRSDKAPGRVSASQITIPLTGTVLNPALKRVDVQVTVSGQTMAKSFQPQQNLTASFTWDGKDGFGRSVAGSQTALVGIGMVYTAAYQSVTGFGGSHGPTDSIQLTANGAEITRWNNQEVQVGLPVVQSSGLGGWELRHHHWFDPETKVLYMGDGRRVQASDVGGILEPFRQLPGNDYWSSSMDQAPDGSLIVAGFGGGSLIRYPISSTDPVTYSYVSSSGATFQPVDVFAVDDSIALVAMGTLISNGKNLPGDVLVYNTSSQKIISDFDPKMPGGWQTRLYSISQLKDRSILISVPADGKIYRIATDGTYSVFAGGGDQTADGTPATRLQLNLPTNARVCPDGQVLVAEEGGNRVWRIDLDGKAFLFAGNGTNSVSGNGGMAVNSGVPGPRGIWCDQNLTSYIAQGPNVAPGEGMEAASYHYIRSVDANGIIRTVAGIGDIGRTKVPTPATEAAIRNPNAPVVGKDGYLYFLDRNNYQICRVRPMYNWSPDSLNAVADPSGRSIHIFTTGGRHLRTVDTRTGAVLRSFLYDGSGALTAEIGSAKDTLYLQRSGSGIDVQGPSAQTTHLTLDANGWLQEVQLPSGQKTSVLHSSTGLLLSWIDPAGRASLFQYDSAGAFSGKLLPDQSSASLAESFAIDTTTLTFRSLESRPYRSVIVEQSSTTAGSKQQRLAYDSAGRISEMDLDLPSASTFHSASGVTDSVHTLQDPHLLTEVQYPGFRRVVVSGTANDTMVDTTRRLSFTNSAGFVDSSFEKRYLHSATPFISQWMRTTGGGSRFGFATPVGRGGLLHLDDQMRIQTDSATGIVGTHLSYGVAGRLDSLRSSGRSLSIQYASGGTLTSLTDAAGRVVQLSQDSTGQFLGRIQSGSSTVPLLSCPSFQGRKRAWDRDNLLQWQSYPEGDTAWFRRDPSGRIAQVHVGTWSSYFHYDTGRRIDTARTTQSEVLALGWWGNWNVQQTWSGPVQGMVTRVVDGSGFVSKRIIDPTFPVTFQRDGDGLLKQVQPGASNAINFVRDSAGLLRSDTCGALAATHTFNAHGELVADTMFKTSGGRVPLWITGQGYDSLGRTIASSTWLSGFTQTAWQYHYNLQGRIDSIWRNGALFGWIVWDSTGERRGGSAQGQAISRRRSGVLDILTQGGRDWAWGAGGRLQWSSTTGGTDTVRYQVDALGRLVGATLTNGNTVQFVLDGWGRRVGKKLNGALTEGYLYDGRDRVAAVLDGSNRLVEEFIYGSKPSVPDLVRRGGILYRVVSGPLGDIHALLDLTSGAVVQAIDYDPFGTPNYLSQSQAYQPLATFGGIWDPLTGTVHLEGRDYVPAAAEWVDRSTGPYPVGDPNLRVRASRGTEVTPWSF